ncbi:MAG: LacI family DNA-binding transcriptional regulator [Acidobacteria bacterium]|nr:LacI family DNA-binding transcriptional regulator [Acidobacteriota bacterium]
MPRRALRTVYDIAKVAGVSVATVSRVLNGHTNVTGPTRDRVLKLIRDSGFRPNANARRLVQGHGGQICFLLSNRTAVHSFHSRILMGVEDFCRQSSQDVVFTTFQYGPEDHFPSAAVPQIIRERGGTEGILLAGANYPNFLAFLGSLGQPFVFFGNNLVTGSLELPSARCVSFDESGGGELAASYLAGLGHRGIVFAGDLSKPWYRRRFEGCRLALAARGLTPGLIDIRDLPDAFELGRRAATLLLSNHATATAVLAQDDETACGLLDGLRRAGIEVPADVSVMGYDDIAEIQYLNPALTTVRVPKEEIGRAMAAELLLPHGRPKPSGTAPLLAPSVIARDSCARPKNGR